MNEQNALRVGAANAEERGVIGGEVVGGVDSNLAAAESVGHF